MARWLPFRSHMFKAGGGGVSQQQHSGNQWHGSLNTWILKVSSFQLNLPRMTAYIGLNFQKNDGQPNQILGILNWGWHQHSCDHPKSFNICKFSRFHNILHKTKMKSYMSKEFVLFDNCYRTSTFFFLPCRKVEHAFYMQYTYAHTNTVQDKPELLCRCVI